MDLQIQWTALQRAALLGTDRTGSPEELNASDWDSFGAGPGACGHGSGCQHTCSAAGCGSG